jgi:hypothetical protein
MTKNEARGTISALLMDSASKFEPADIDRFIDAALADLSRVKPRMVAGELTLVADQANYTAPADLVSPIWSNWGKKELTDNRPWNSDWPGRLPRLGMIVQDDVRMLYLDPAPTSGQINLIGATYGYQYRSSYALGDTAVTTTVPAEFDQLLLVRALAAAMLALAMNGVAKPVMIGKAGIGGMPKNGSPAYLHDQLLELFERMAA